MTAIQIKYFQLKAIAETSDDFISASHQALRAVLEHRRLLAKKIITSTLDFDGEQLLNEEIYHLNSIVTKFYNL